MVRELSFLTILFKVVYPYIKGAFAVNEQVSFVVSMITFFLLCKSKTES